MSRNQQLFDRAQLTIPGGVNSPVRAFKSVGGTPRFIDRADGPYMWDADGKQYIDYIQSWGPMILGHGDKDVIEAVQKAATRGFSFGAPTEGEIELAELICELIPSIEQVRLVSSGTEATMSAIRLARGFTGRSLLVKFEGCYHGHSDSLLVKAGSGLLTFGQTSSAGVPEDIAKHTLVLPFNDIEALETVFAEKGNEIAAVIIEPFAGNMNLIAPGQAYHQRLRELCTNAGSVLIFDEVMTGFRVGLTGVQGRYGITPDLTTLGKVIGGGMPVGAFGGRKDIMAHIAPLGGVYQAGTLSGNPLAVTAGLVTLNKIRQPGFYDTLTARAARLAAGFQAEAVKAGVPCTAQSMGSMFGVYFTPTIPQNFAEVTKSDIARFNAFFHAMLDEGVYLAPSAYEAGFVSIVHDDAIIDETIAAAGRAFSKV
ncbi:glutamate-1-semialdehyde 2,1-aminomutase [Leeia sp. TBRC 13508]|uniref:Glutamate-1-semialdehyde 2,1-aminomutase n=1 Tax=Leeia speluncae TaxID=2884804 RepID=A0ABS8D3H6_9NEIS|nr:glutamate-1-semialdehyde 2,1-aminomutase [Leeia speluncae]MCB6182736.1 glutamate-1-semialdehyde 2,1-aminomutase [Leeia speluncae]